MMLLDDTAKAEVCIVPFCTEHLRQNICGAQERSVKSKSSGKAEWSSKNNIFNEL